MTERPATGYAVADEQTGEWWGVWHCWIKPFDDAWDSREVRVFETMEQARRAIDRSMRIPTSSASGFALDLSSHWRPSAVIVPLREVEPEDACLACEIGATGDGALDPGHSGTPACSHHEERKR